MVGNTIGIIIWFEWEQNRYFDTPCSIVAMINKWKVGHSMYYIETGFIINYLEG